MADASRTSSGVQELISRIRDDGVRAARDEAERILTEARERAARMVAEGRGEIEVMRERALAEIEAERVAALEALRVAARDTVLQLRAGITSEFERYLKRLVSSTMADRDLIRQLVLVLAGSAAREQLTAGDMLIGLAAALAEDVPLDESQQERLRDFVLGISGEMLRDGIELVATSEIRGGARVRLAGQDLEIDLTDEAISQLMAKRLLPRFRSVLEGTE